METEKLDPNNLHRLMGINSTGQFYLVHFSPDYKIYIQLIGKNSYMNTPDAGRAGF